MHFSSICNQILVMLEVIRHNIYVVLHQQQQGLFHCSWGQVDEGLPLCELSTLLLCENFTVQTADVLLPHHCNANENKNSYGMGYCTHAYLTACLLHLRLL